MDGATACTAKLLQHEQWRLKLQEEIRENELKFTTSKGRWNRVHYSSLILGIGLPTLSALTLKLESITNAALKNDIAAGLAAMGAIATAMMATFNVRKRWALSRLTRMELHKLKVEVMSPDANLAQVADQLKHCLAKYNLEAIEE